MEKQESELNITEEELKRFQNAMKSEEFRKLFSDYAKEISDPENKKRYEEEIAQLEAERGMAVKFINPQDGFVLKTSIKSEGGRKAFINICHSDVVGQATCKTSSKNIDKQSVKGQEWAIPYSLNQPREDLDKAGKKCTVYDIIFHTKTYQMGQEDPRFKQLIFNTTFDALEGNWKVKLDRKNLKYPKLKFKGTKTSSIIRTSNDKDKDVNKSGDGIGTGDKKLPYPYKDKILDLQDKTNVKSSELENKSFHTPKYSIVHRGHMDLQNFTNARDSRTSTRPQELVVNIELPLRESSAGVDLDIFEKQLILHSSNPNYHLDISLPYPVKEDEGRAQFDKSKRRLIITLPVIPAPPVALNGYADNWSAESKENGLVTEIVNDNVDHELKHVVNDVDNRDDGAGNHNDDNRDGNDIGDNNNDNHDDDHDNLNGDNNNDNHDDDHDNCNRDNHGDGGADDHGGDKSSENVPNHFEAENADISHNACRDVDSQQRVNRSSGVTCPVFKTPPYTFHQNKESVTFVLHVSNVSLDTMSLGFTGNKCCINFPSSSITSTSDLSPGYAFYIQFPDQCLIDSERSSVDLNDTNLVVVLHKRESCVGLWQWFLIGSDEHTSEKKVFLTEETLQESLDQVNDHWAQQPATIRHKVESASEEETVIQLDINRETSADSSNMGNILAGAEELLINEVKHGSSSTMRDNVDLQSRDDIKNETKKNCDAPDAEDDTVIIKYEDLDEVEVIEESDEDNHGADGVSESQRLSTVQEVDATNEEKADTATGDAEMQRARAIKCRKNRRRRRRSTGSHDQSSSVSEEECDGMTRRGKQRGKHARRQRMSRSLSFGSSADSHDDVDGQRCVRFNPVPEVRVFSNKADKRKWKELRKQQTLDGSTKLDLTPKVAADKMCKLKSSLKDSRSSVSDKEGLSVSSDDTTAHDSTEVGSCEDTAKDIIGDDVIHNNDKDDQDNDDDDDDDIDNEDSFVKLDKPQLTNPLIFDLDD